jgi:hypothetical protein
MQLTLRKSILAGILAIILYSIGQVIYGLIRTSPCNLEPVFDSGSRCAHLFQDSVKQDLNCFYSFGNNNVAIYAYNFQDKFRYVVWELGDFRNVDLRKVNFNKSNSLEEIKSIPFAHFELGGGPSIKVKDIICYSMREELNLFVGNGGNLSIDTIGNHYIIASGELNEISIANYKNENQILISFETFPTFSSLIFLKKNQTFFIILINSFENKISPKVALNYLKLN